MRSWNVNARAPRRSASRAATIEKRRRPGHTLLAWTLAVVVGLTSGLGAGGAMASATFEAWVSELRREAVAAGVSGDVFDTAFAEVTPNPRVLELDSAQPEFTTPLWVYLDRLVSDERVATGLAARDEVQDRLIAIENIYGVPAEVVVAIWGVESNFGENRGSYGVIRSLATLAYEGRRAAFWREQLIEALRILTSGDVNAERMTGSWAGAMGHTQFIPTSYRDYAVDFDGDGRRDIWAEDPGDALASAANYLARFGWRKGEPWGLQVRTPANFDYTLASAVRKTTEEWAAIGVTLSSGGALPGGFEDAELLLPAGAQGPAFLTLPNFRVILRYNNATSYALAVSLLSERLDGRPPRALQWPDDERGLSLAERKELQQSLSDLGFDAGGVDGILGRNSRSAIRAFQASQSMIADGFPSAALLTDVRSALAAKNAPILAVGRPAAPSTEDLREMQALLTVLGYDTGGVDGIVGPRTRAAISGFRADRGLEASAEPTVQILEMLRQAVRTNGG